MKIVFSLLVLFALFCLFTAETFAANFTIEFARTNYALTEGQVLELHLRVTGGDPFPATTVRMARTGGSAVYPVDWSSSFGGPLVQGPPEGPWDVSVLSGEPDFGVPGYFLAVDDGIHEEDETVELALSALDGEATIGQNGKTVVTIHNLSTQIYVSGWSFEGEATGNLYMHRAGDRETQLSIDYALVDSTAIAGVDYRPVSGHLQLGPGAQDVTSSIPSPVIDNGKADGTRYAHIVLSHPVPSIALPEPGFFTIMDNERCNVLDTSFRQHDRVQMGTVLVGVQRNGCLLAAGPLNGNFSFFRLLPNGSLDPSFSSVEVQGTASGLIHATVFHGVEQRDQRWIVGWTLNQSDSPPIGNLIRLASTGALDPSFSPRQNLLTNRIGSLALETDEKLLVQIGTQILRLNTDGSDDSTFRPIPLNSDSAQCEMVFQSDSKLLLAAWDSSGMPFLRRFKSNGDQDDAFQTPVFQLGETNPVIANFLHLALQSDQRILASGAFNQVNGFPRLGIVRFLSNGIVDASWKLDLASIESWTVSEQSDEFIANQYDAPGYPPGGLQRFATNGALIRNYPGLSIPTFTPLHGGKFLITQGRYLNHWYVSSPAYRIDLTSADTPGAYFFGSLEEYTRRSLTAELYESAGETTVSVFRYGDSTAAFSVRLSGASTGAQPGKDYLLPETLLAFAPLETEKTLPIRVLDNNVADQDRNVTLELTDSSGTLLDRATPILIDDDEPGRHFSRIRSFLGAVELVFNAPIGESWIVEASTDLKQWTRENLQGDEGTNNVRRFWQDVADIQGASRFYRALKR